ncbi:plasmid maintenance system antidote protein VapI [Paenibacillus forsythiae]|uniref:Plasmid maintenance system antidote protein VapI n=1 Tax=Paenibacillus forsythiae TaxID=365616 RepID=A0ABU3H304_9BACL|nr:helix-turn-helix transcriptional regulator [Paenibacillus forsythiae]MDT3425204.1 plasmid maintenance system antidote protein VapI [Paenibacillus forsythiae]
MANEVNAVAIAKVRVWLEANEKSIQWLADQIAVSKALMGHILNGERQFLPKRMVQVANVIGVTTQELLTPDHTEEKEYTLSLRGKADSRIAKRHLNILLHAIENSRQLEKALAKVER